MATSQNGYIANREELTRVFEIPRCNRHIRLRQGAPGLMLVHFAAWYDREIEPLDQGEWDEWGYAERPIRGSDTLSNHASGTAMDLNATKHPMGVPTRETFSNAQVEKIHKRLKLYRGCIGWGGDYQNRPDAMHYEITRNVELVRRRWKVLRHTPLGRQVLLANNG